MASDLLAKSLNDRFTAISTDLTSVKSVQAASAAKIDSIKAEVSAEIDAKIEQAFKDFLQSLEGISNTPVPSV